VKFLRLVLGVFICVPALLLPYRLRIVYLLMVAWLVHLPFFIFGSFAKWMLKKLEVENPYVG
jgi:hypothetical protein